MDEPILMIFFYIYSRGFENDSFSQFRKNMYICIDLTKIDRWNIHRLNKNTILKQRKI